MTSDRYARVQELFLQACELDKAGRHAFLVQQCADDDGLRKEVEALLEHDDSRTLIRAGDETVPDFRPGTVVHRVKRSVGRRLKTVGLLTNRLGAKGYLALGGFIACVVLILVALLAGQGLQSFQRTLRAATLREILDAKIAGLEMWFDHEAEKAASWSRSKELQRLTNELVQLASESTDEWDDVRNSPLQGAIQQELHRVAAMDVGYSIWDRRNILIADSSASGHFIGNGVTPDGASVLTAVFAGKSRVFSYNRDHLITERGPSEKIEPNVGVVAPIHGSQGRVTAALLVHDIGAQEKAGRILRMVRLGKSGETYVFDKDGVMLSESRFTPQLREIGLLPANGESGTSGVLQLRDPGGDMTTGHRPLESLSALPLTKMARHATAGEAGVDMDGYRDYRGVLVVGAWHWLDEHQVGLATELDVNESEPGHWIIVLATWVAFGLLATCLGIIVFSYYSILRLRGQLGEHHQLGRYTLEQQIGEGGMGKVFKARHEFLKRPTAIKLLKPELVDKQSIARFEREARLAGQLTHPNTVDVYDYGVTPEGIFFFVMEHINGLSLAELVDRHGPLPPGRVIYLLKQIAESLEEAHGATMIHRDLKPQNIMVCRRGGKADVVKVLDFGLVKCTQATESQQLTATSLLAGTPLYIAPERLRDPSSANPQTDIYSLGAVTYFLLTGREVFRGNSVSDILFQVMNTQPPRPADTRTDIPLQLDELVVDCLAKEPTRRPSSVSQIVRVLEGLESLETWEQAMAQRWWDDHMPNEAASPVA